MEARKKRGIGFFIGGAICVIFGIVTFSTAEDPSWLVAIPQIVGVIAGYLGFQIVYPDS